LKNSPSGRRCPTYQDLLEIHARVLAAGGGAGGVLDPSRLRAAIERPRSGFGDFELFSSVFQRAAALAHALAAGHPFVDGNKRTALLAAEAMLEINGLRLCASDDEAVAAILALATGRMTVDEFSAWLEEHAVPSSPRGDPDPQA